MPTRAAVENPTFEDLKVGEILTERYGCSLCPDWVAPDRSAYFEALRYEQPGGSNFAQHNRSVHHGDAQLVQGFFIVKAKKTI